MVCISSSIDNFRDKILGKYGRNVWSIATLRNPTVFFGMYHWVDYLRLAVHRGFKEVFWCGSDILNLSKRPFWQFVIRKIHAAHTCENEVEQKMLASMGIHARVAPRMFDTLFKPEICYQHSKKPHVFLTTHEDRVNYAEKYAPEVSDVTFHVYGIEGSSHDNVVYHGKVSNEQFNTEIRNYQAALRPEPFDGFSESVAKSILLGQYPITGIKYSFIEHGGTDKQIISHLNNLKAKTSSNRAGFNHWLKILT